MTPSEASKILQDHTGMRLLESLELLTDSEAEREDAPSEVRAAYHSLMAGFTKMFYGAEA